MSTFHTPSGRVSPRPPVLPQPGGKETKVIVGGFLQGQAEFGHQARGHALGADLDDGFQVVGESAQIALLGIGKRGGHDVRAGEY